MSETKPAPKPGWMAILLIACFVLFGIGLYLVGARLTKTRLASVRPPRIAVVPKATSHIFWQAVQAGALAAGKDLKVDVEWNGPTQETDYSRQIQIVDAMIAQHVDGLAVAASDRQALNASLDCPPPAPIPRPGF